MRSDLSVVRDEGVGVAYLACPTGAADAVDVVFVLDRSCVVDDVGDISDVDTTGGDICRDQVC